MTTPIDILQADLKDALKAREKQRLGTLRLLLTAVKNEQIEKGEALDQAAFLKVVQRAIKQRKDSVTQYRKGGREELAAQEEIEIEVLTDYLPAQASEAEIRATVESFVAENNLQGPQAMGAVMGAVLAQLGASADGGTVSRIARQVLTGS